MPEIIRRRRSPVRHGITFAPVALSGGDILRLGKHTYMDWDLVPTSAPTIPTAPDVTPTVSIPGAIYVPELRLTAPAGGRPSFGLRTGSWEFRPRRTGLWARRLSDMASYLNGQTVKVVLDDEQAYYYVGTVMVEAWEIGDMSSTVRMSYELWPYKYEITDSLEPWLWDPFSFVDGIIRDYGDLAVNEVRNLVIYGREMPVIPDFYPVTNGTGLTVTYNGATHKLYAEKNGTKYDGINHGLSGYTVEAGTTYDPETGRFTVSGLELGAGDHVLTFTGTGTVSVAYRGGRL